MSDDQTYNGWANWETWNVALWIQTDEWLYELAKRGKDYKDFTNNLSFLFEHNKQTPDGVSWNDSSLDIEELDKMIEEL